MSGFDLSGYVTVNERVEAFWKRHPKGRILTSVLTDSEERFTVKAEVYLTGEDIVPAATGHSYMAVPGKTPYTRGAELENAETSAVGRALGMLGIGTTKSIASADEVAAKASPADPDAITVEGFIERLTDNGFAMKAGATRYHVVTNDELDSAEGLKVVVTGPVKKVAWKNSEGKSMPPYKSITAQSVTYSEA